MYKLRTFADDLGLILKNSLGGINVLTEELKEFGELAEFKSNKEKKNKDVDEEKYWQRTGELVWSSG